MECVIISDIHDNIVNLEKCLSWCKNNNIKSLVCCGDITNTNTLHVLATRFKNDIFLVRGNIELYKEENLAEHGNINYLGRFGTFELGGKIVGVCHEQHFIKDVLEEGVCDIIFYGHSHAPWESRFKKTKIVNPGTLGGVFQKASFAAWNIKTGSLDLKILEAI